MIPGGCPECAREMPTCFDLCAECAASLYSDGLVTVQSERRLSGGELSLAGADHATSPRSSDGSDTYSTAPTGEEDRSPQEIEDAQIASGLGRSLAGDQQ